MKKIITLIISFMVTSTAITAEMEKITFGFAETDITPELDIKIRGNRTADGIYSRLYAQCIAMKDHKGRIMLFVGADVIYFDRVIVEKIREHCLEKHGIKPSDILFSASHVHFVPPPWVSLPYGKQLPEKLTPMIDEVIKNCTTEGHLKIGRTTSKLGISRRKPEVKDGEKRILFATYPDGIIDETLTIIAFYDTSKTLRNFVWIYGAHPTGFGRFDGKMMINADFVGEVRDVFRREFPNAGTLFMQGAAGDVSCGVGDAQHTTIAKMEKYVLENTKKIIEFIQTMDNEKPEPVDIKSALGTFNLTYDTTGDILTGKIYTTPSLTPLKTREQLEEQIASPDTDEREQRTLKRRLETGWFTGGKPESTWQRQKISLNDNIQILGMSGEPSSSVAEILYESFEDQTVIFVGYIMAGSYTTAWKQQAEGGYQAKGYGPDIDETIINAFKELQPE